MTDSINSCKAVLFGGRPEKELDVETLLAQYRLFVETSESLVLRRQGVNRFFLSVNSLVLAGAGLLLRDGGTTVVEALVVILLALGGALLSFFVWRRLITSFLQLSKGKFKVIHELERQLPARMFTAEWDALGRGEDPKIYRPFTKVESATPVVFGIVQVLLLGVGIVMLF